MAGLAVSLMLGLGLALLLALVDDRLYDRFDVEKLELAPLLIVVPRGGAKHRRPRG
jgi:capsular polysaccharide biosynthesis protein